MNKFFLTGVCLCLSIATNAQSYRGSDADRMMFQRMQQQSRQNSSGNTYTPQRSYGNGYNGNGYNGNSYSGSNYGQSTNSYGSPDVEKVIQGVYVYYNQLALMRLRYYNGKIMSYSTSRDMLGREQWQSMYPDNPHPTMEFQDGQLAREYKYKVSVTGTTVYFNL